jgi:hypothetical protein
VQQATLQIKLLRKINLRLRPGNYSANNSYYAFEGLILCKKQRKLNKIDKQGTV